MDPITAANVGLVIGGGQPGTPGLVDDYPPSHANDGLHAQVQSAIKLAR